jgi:DNA-binding winged helix-turn-helix (wHTH) protein/tetratricopeptide (TPR) repeat protein
MSNESFLFRDFRLDPSARELWQGATLIALPSRAFDCLVYLIRHRDRAIGRDELISAVWGRVDIADTLLAQTILRLRRAIGDTGGSGSGAVRTVARFGYRWVEETRVGIAPAGEADTPGSSRAPAQQANDEVVPPPVTATASMPPVPSPATVPGRRAVSRTTWALAVAAVLALALAAWWSTPDAPTAPAYDDSVPDPAIADAATVPAAATVMVMPATVPDLPDWAWLRLGLMDMVGNRLRMAGLPTLPSENVLAMMAGDPGQSALPMAEDRATRIQPVVERRGDTWHVSLDMRSPELPLHVEARGAGPVDAAHAAADLLLIRLGRIPPAQGEDRPDALADLLLRVRAAVLADQFGLAVELIERAPEAIRAQPEVELERALIEQGQGQYADAERRLETLRAAVIGESRPALRGRILAASGSINFRRLNLDEAEREFAEAIELLTGRNDPIGLAHALIGRAAVASRRDMLDESAADLGRARVEMEAAGDVLGTAQIDMNLGLLQIKRYRPSTAVPLLREAETRFAALGAREELAYVRYVTAGAQLQLLDLDGAMATIASFWPPESHTGNARLHWRLALSRAFVLSATGQLSAADAQIGRIETGAGDADDAAVLIGARALAAQITAIRGDHALAVEQLRSVLTPTLLEQRPDQYITIWMAYLRSLRHVGEMAMAREQTDAFAGWIVEHPNPWRDIQAALALAEQDRAEGRADSALAHFADAFERAQQLAIPEDLVHVAEPYTMALIENGMIDRASAVVGRVAAWAEQDIRAAWAQANLYRAQARTEAWERALERVERLRGERIMPPVDDT